MLFLLISTILAEKVDFNGGSTYNLNIDANYSMWIFQASDYSYYTFTISSKSYTPTRGVIRLSSNADKDKTPPPTITFKFKPSISTSFEYWSTPIDFCSLYSMVLPTSLHKFTYQATESVDNLCFFFPERSSLTEYRIDSSSTVQIHDGSTESYQENYIARKSLTTDEITTIRFPNLLNGEIITITQSNPLPTYIDQCNRYTTYGIDSGDGSDTKTLEIQADSVKCTTPTETFEPSNVFSASNTFPSATEKPSNIGLIIGIVVAVVVVIVVAVVVVVCMLKKKKIQNQSVP